MAMMTLQQMIEAATRIHEAKRLRIATGMWLRVSEVRLRDASQMPALREHIASVTRAVPDLATVMFGIPVIYDDTVEVGMIRFVFEDDSTDDRPMR